MTPADPAPNPKPAPTPAEVLRWCADAAPQLWFPSGYAQAAGIPRDSLDDPLWLLRQAGLIQVSDWVRGQGQGFTLTPAGVKALADPRPLTLTVPPPTLRMVDDVPPEDADLAQVPDPVPALPRERGFTEYDRGELTREAFLDPRPAVITPVLMVANVGWFLVGLVVAWQVGVSLNHYLQGVEDVGRVLTLIGAAFGPELWRGEWWRLATAGFVHIGVLHLLANLFSLYMIGPVAEALWGRWRFAALYVIAGLAGTCAAMALQPTSGVAGASGSIWGVMLAVVAWLLRYRRHLPPDMVRSWLKRLLLMIVINAAISFAPGISWEAHFGGGLMGFFAALFLDLTRVGASRRQVLIGLGGILGLVLIMTGGLVTAVMTTKSWQVIRAVVFLQDKREDLMAMAALAKIQPVRLDAVHKSVSLALVTRTPGALGDAKLAVMALQTDRNQAVGSDHLTVDPERMRAYLEELRLYAELAQARLEANRTPTAAEWKALADQKTKTSSAWPTPATAK